MQGVAGGKNRPASVAAARSRGYDYDVARVIRMLVGEHNGLWPDCLQLAFAGLDQRSRGRIQQDLNAAQIGPESTLNLAND